MSTPLSLNSVLERLGYTKDHNYGPPVNFIGHDSQIPGLVGVYKYQTSIDKTLPDRPIVYIAEANDDNQAKEIHRKLWNQGNSPFIFIFLPTEIVIYSGFNYPTERGEEREPLFEAIKRTSYDIDRALSKDNYLRSFTAESIDSGRIWETWGKHLSTGNRIDKNLLKNLQALSHQLQDQPFQLRQSIAHSLIGKYIYFRYMWDRKILTPGWLHEKNLTSESVFGREATLTGFVNLSRLLQETFNGEIFPLEDMTGITDEVIQYVASVFNGDDPRTGQIGLFDATVFKIYEFDYIPVELLSSIYEQFLHEQNVAEKKDAGGGAGAYYTPKFVADYVLSELNAACPLTIDTKVLDPSCGSGIFLVLTYQRLVHLHEIEKGKKLTREELRQILINNIFGIEINSEACSITEFSLLLALMSYLHPRDLQENEGFHFPHLRNNNIFHADFFVDSQLFKKEVKFQWIVGNPPWLGASLKKPSDIEKGKQWDVFEAWLEIAKKKKQPIGNRRICEAFCWRASELVSQNGALSLLIHATTLVNEKSSDFRKAFFKQMTVYRITNFTNLADLLFEKSNAPAAVIVYTVADEKMEKKPIIHFSPFAINQNILQNISSKDKAWTISINKDEIQWINYEDAEADQENLWKICLWGTYHDRRTLQRLNRLFPLKLGHVIDNGIRESGWHFGRGPEVKDKSQSGNPNIEYQAEFENKKQLSLIDLNRIKPRPYFHLPMKALSEPNPNKYYMNKRGSRIGIDLIKPPHLLISVSYALYSEVEFVIPDPQIGLSVSDTVTDRNLLKCIAMFLNSSIGRYMLFFNSPTWGFSVDKIGVHEVKNLPFPRLQASQINDIADQYNRIAKIEEDYFSKIDHRNSVNGFELVSDGNAESLQFINNEIDTVLENTLRIPHWITVLAQEFIQIRLQLKKGKTKEIGRQGQRTIVNMSPVDPPLDNQLKIYAESLRNELDAFARVRHRVSVHQSPNIIVAKVEITNIENNSDNILPITINGLMDNSYSSFLLMLRHNNQWSYVQRSIKRFDGDKYIYMIKQNRLLDWTQTQAFLDAGDIIGGVLNGGK